MKRPALVGEIERRLLVNYRADPDVVAPLLPPPLRPQLHGGAAVVGICLIRLDGLRLAGWPRGLGLRSENAAHRIAVEWEAPGGTRQGVFVARRDSGAVANVLAGGRLYPGVHHRATFDVRETDDDLWVAFAAHDGSVHAQVEVTVSHRLGGSLFADVGEASRFFAAGSVGLSPGRRGGVIEALELHTERWSVEPVTVRRARSSFFDDTSCFPPGSVELDCGLLMRGVPVTWDPSPVDLVQADPVADPSRAAWEPRAAR